MELAKRKTLAICSLLVFSVLLVITFVFAVPKIEVSAAEFAVNNKQPRQGSLLKITAPAELKSGKVVLRGKSYPLHREDGEQIALLPISYWVKPGEHKLTVVDKDGTTQQQWTIQVQVGEFTESYLQVDEENEKKVNPTDPERKKRKQREQKLVYQARMESSSRRLWSGSFQEPVEGQVTTDFGATRYHNGELANRHSGIDIAAVEGTPIKAVNSGRVVLAHNLLRTGKTVIIDHGWNVFSSYLHCSELKVKTGDQVKRGEVIGLVGDTGFSTGSHLHWSISVGRTFVNPRDFLDLGL